MLRVPAHRVIALCATCLLVASLVFSRPAAAFNSEEHKILGELGAAGVFAPDVAFPLGVAFFDIDKAEDLAAYTAAKLFAVGFITNDPASDYSDELKKIQDNSYWNGFAQSGSVDAPYEGNLWMWVPPDEYLAARRLELAMPEAPGQRLTFGQLVAFYGDFRKVPYCQTGACYVTNADTPTTTFEAGSNWFLNPFDSGWRPDPMPTSTYIQHIASGLWPPYGSGGNTVSNTAGDTEYEEAGWWGDELLRNAAINDCHFATAALSWYVGMHRLALRYAQMAAENPIHWAAALHYEANALHSYTDLFAFGHIVTHRDAASYGIVEEEGGGLVQGETFQWMEAVIEMGGASRVSSDCKGLGNYTCRRWQYPAGAVAFPDLTELPHGRVDFLPAYAPGVWANWTLKEKRYHTAFNDAGACVRNLRGDAFYTYGDSGLRFMTPGQVPEQSLLCGVATRDGIGVISQGVRASLQTIFDAHQAAVHGVAYVDSPGAPAFTALTYLPAYVISNPMEASTALAGLTFDYGAEHFTGRWVTYASSMEAIAGTATLPVGWSSCAIPYIDGGESLPPENSPSCNEFPLVATPHAPTTVPGGEVVFTAAGGSDAALFPLDPGYTWSLETNMSGATIDSGTGVYTAGPVGGDQDVVQLTDGLGDTVLVTVSVLEPTVAPGPEAVEPVFEVVEPVEPEPLDAGPEVVSESPPDQTLGADLAADVGAVDARGTAQGCASAPSPVTPTGLLVMVICGLLGLARGRRQHRSKPTG